MKTNNLDLVNRPSAMRFSNAMLREYLADAANAVKLRDWDRATHCYQRINELSSLLREASDRNRKNEVQQ